MLVSVKKILMAAEEEGVAVGAFNVSTVEVAQSIVEAAERMHRPTILQITEKTMAFWGPEEVVSFTKKAIEVRGKNSQYGLHLDHGRSFEACKLAVDLGFTSVMIDGSQLSFAENKNLTKMVADYAHERGIDVQGEIGTVPYLGKGVLSDKDWEEYMTNPEQAKEFVEFTGIDSLAVGIGNAHGFQKEKDIPDWERLRKLNELVKVPLILHGASDWPESKVKKAVAGGINCFNVDTDIRLTYMGSLSRFFKSGSPIDDPRKSIEQARRAVQQKVEEKIKMFLG